MILTVIKASVAGRTLEVKGSSTVISVDMADVTECWLQGLQDKLHVKGC